MKIIAGLGNPGLEYAKTRHNAGFMVLARLAERYNLTSTKHRFHSESLDGRIAGEKVMLLSPLTYMNKSGLAINEALRFYKAEPADLIVVVDDIALPCGKIRLRASGSAGGHNGLSDIENRLATRDYPRLRIGIDPPGRIPQIDYVLGRFTEQQLAELDPALDQACDAIECWLTEGIQKAMSLFNG